MVHDDILVGLVYKLSLILGDFTFWEVLLSPSGRSCCPSIHFITSNPLKHLFKSSNAQKNKRVEIVADDASHSERRCYMDFVVTSEWNPFLPLTNSSLARHRNFACLSFLICE